MSESLGGLDVSLRDFESPPRSPESLRHSLGPSESSAMSVGDRERYNRAWHRSRHPDPLADENGNESADESARDHLDSDTGSVGGYSPPAWRRLDNGDRSSGFWRGPIEFLTSLPQTSAAAAATAAAAAVASGVPRQQQQHFSRLPSHVSGPPPLDVDLREADDYFARRRRSEHEDLLERAIQTRLPRCSLSPEKDARRSLSPEPIEDLTVRVQQQSPGTEMGSPEPPAENYIRFAVRAEVQQRTEPIETAIHFIRKHYTTLTATWSSTLLTLLSIAVAIAAMKTLVQRPSARPAGDLVKVAGVARSFEPLIYYSEHAVAQVQDLQATSVAVWDLGESVRSSDMRDAGSIVSDLDALSDTMKTLAEEMTRFFARVDGDIDGILNVMDWAQMHLNRFRSDARHASPSTLSSAYDNVHNLLSAARVFEDATGRLTPLGHVATWVFGPSNPQREQQLVQLLFREFISVLEESITTELQHAVSLFALFEAVDRHFLNLARTVVRESSAQDHLYADLLSGLWARILGPRAADVLKFERNRELLRDLRDKTVRHKTLLVDHNGKLLTLKASLEGLRAKLVSPLVRGANATTLSLEDQIQGLSDVSHHLGQVRLQQKGRVMEAMFGGSLARNNRIDENRPITAATTVGGL